MIPGEVHLNEQYFPDIKINKAKTSLDIESLLSRPVENLGSSLFSDRWNVFNKFHELALPRTPIMFFPTPISA